MILQLVAVMFCKVVLGVSVSFLFIAVMSEIGAYLDEQDRILAEEQRQFKLDEDLTIRQLIARIGIEVDN